MGDAAGSKARKAAELGVRTIGMAELDAMIEGGPDMSIAEEKQMIRQQIKGKARNIDGFIRDLREALPDYFMSIDDAELTGRLEKAGTNCTVPFFQR